MNRALIAVALGIALFAGGFGAGWAWRDDRAERDAESAIATNARDEVRFVNQARASEHQQADTLATIGAKHEEDRAAATAIPAAVAAGVRDGSLQLRDDLATCNTSLLSQAVTGAVERDAHAQLRGEVAGAVVQVGRDADDHVSAAQAVVAADRAEVMP